MRSYAREGEQPATALEALREQYPNDVLTRLVRNLCGPKPPTRKDELLAQLVKLVDRDHLRTLWASLDPIEQSAVAETAWNDDGRFDQDRFKAKYGRLPTQSRAHRYDYGYEEDDDEGDEDERGGGSGGRERGLMFGGGRQKQEKASILEVLIPYDVMARDVQKRLREFVPEPAAAKIQTVESPPDHLDLPTYIWNPKTKESEKGIEAVPLVRRDMERSAARDLTAVLRLVDAGKVTITDKNRWPTPGAMRAVASVLDGGDYYEAKPPKPPKSKKSAGRKGDDDSEDGDDEEDEEQAAGPIRAFAWPMLLQAGKLAHISGNRLALTKAGRAALTAPPHETLRELWQKWLVSDVLDELRRVNAIRGQTGKGRRGLTDPVERREAIADALADCPVGQWVSAEDFSRYLRAAGHEFKVSSAPWWLYIAEMQYGSLGDADNWRIFQFRYLLAFLMEYAGTLGLLDLAYMPPAGARADYGSLWGTDDLAYLSRYDGLFYFRLNPLGAFCLGSAKAYAPPPPEARRVLSVRADLDVVTAGELSPADRLMLDAFARKTGDDTWRLDRDKVLAAAAGGREIREIVEFLESSSGEALPDPAVEFFDDAEERLHAFTDLGPARVIGCKDPALAAFIANDPATQKSCHRLNENLLVVPGKSEAAFFRALRKLGYVLPGRPGEPDP